MSVNRSENIKDNELSPHTQPFVTMRLVAVFAMVLIALPLLPALIANLAYSFSGQAPKIYWYLSRAGGFIALSILWVSMAMGLGLTNKLARWWPGVPAAFAVHEYVSLLGLLFAAYHALVLIGDHYVDFSLARLLVPFSIRYEPFWVGLGQVAFYTWVIVLLSFYIRQFIGQKTWRMIHYANFATYMMGLFHGLFSGTDGTAGWAHWYYGISAATLIALVVYRVYVTIHKRKASRPKPAREVEQSPQVLAAADAPIPAPVGIVPQAAPSLEQVSAPLESPAPTEQPAPVSEPVIVALQQMKACPSFCR
jgi:predicted ferric reductase